MPSGAWSGHNISFKARGNQLDVRSVVDRPGGEGRPKSGSASQLSRAKRTTGIPNRLPFTPPSKIPKSSKSFNGKRCGNRHAGGPHKAPFKKNKDNSMSPLDFLSSTTSYSFSTPTKAPTKATKGRRKVRRRTKAATIARATLLVNGAHHVHTDTMDCVRSGTLPNKNLRIVQNGRLICPSERWQNQFNAGCTDPQHSLQIPETCTTQGIAAEDETPTLTPTNVAPLQTAYSSEESYQYLSTDEIVSVISEVGYDMSSDDLERLLCDKGLRKRIKSANSKHKEKKPRTEHEDNDIYENLNFEFEEGCSCTTGTTSTSSGSVTQEQADFGKPKENIDIIHRKQKVTNLEEFLISVYWKVDEIIETTFFPELRAEKDTPKVPETTSLHDKTIKLDAATEEFNQSVRKDVFCCERNLVPDREFLKTQYDIPPNDAEKPSGEGGRARIKRILRRRRVLQKPKIPKSNFMLLKRELLPDPDPTESSTTATGQTVSNVDRRGTIRGPCTLCKDCEQYEVENGLSCDYCGCPPGKHKNIGHFNQQSLAKPLQVDQQTALPSEPSSFGRAPVYPQQTPQQNTKSTRKPLSVSDVSDLPGSMTLENAINYLSLERAQSTEFGKPAHFSSPELNLSDRQSTNQSYRSDMISNRSDVASSNDLGAIYQAMSRRNTNAYDRSRSDVDIPKLGEWEDENTFEIAEDMSGSGPQNYTSPTATLTLRQDSTDETCRIVPLNGGDVVRGVLKEPIQLKVDITPITIKKHHVLWFHNNKKISPRYRVRFVNERREIHILSLRKKDAGVYKCQIKHSSGKEKKTTACTMILDVQVPHFVAKDL